jgi:SAM-dependent methyltransferase
LKVDYDEVARTYPTRYSKSDYGGTEATIDRLSVGTTNILEVGCGTGHWVSRLRAPSRRVVGIDPSGEMLRQAAATLPAQHLIRGSAEALPLAANQFDLVLVVNALHHFASLEGFAHEAARVLQPGGRLAVIGLDPSKLTDAWYVYDYFPTALLLDRERYPSSDTISAVLRTAGFGRISTGLAEHIVQSERARPYLEEGHLHRHVTSQLSLLSEEQYERGVHRIWEDIREAEGQGQHLELFADLRLYVTEGRLVDA